jgi:phosphopantothenoylcysteine synthetase/decarboxylase
MNSGVGVAPPERFRSTAMETSALVIPPRSTRQRRSDRNAAIPTASTPHTGSNTDSECKDDEEDEEDDNEYEDENENEDDTEHEDDKEHEDDNNQKPGDEIALSDNGNFFF